MYIEMIARKKRLSQNYQVVNRIGTKQADEMMRSPPREKERT
jgi:hypothetical protein